MEGVLYNALFLTWWGCCRGCSSLHMTSAKSKGPIIPAWMGGAREVLPLATWVESYFSGSVAVGTWCTFMQMTLIGFWVILKGTEEAMKVREAVLWKHWSAGENRIGRRYGRDTFYMCMTLLKIKRKFQNILYLHESVLNITSFLMLVYASNRKMMRRYPTRFIHDI